MINLEKEGDVFTMILDSGESMEYVFCSRTK